MRKNQGFILLGLTFAVVIAGGLAAAIALPNLIMSVGGCGGKARALEGKSYAGAMNRSQQAYFFEESKFSNSIAELGLGMRARTDNYDYSIRTTAKAAFSYAIASNNKSTKSYVGGVFAVPAKRVAPTAAEDELNTQAILCETNSVVTGKPAEPTYQNGKLACGAGTNQIR